MHGIVLKKFSCFGRAARPAACATSAGLACVGGGQKSGTAARFQLNATAVQIIDSVVISKSTRCQSVSLDALSKTSNAPTRVYTCCSSSRRTNSKPCGRKKVSLLCVERAILMSSSLSIVQSRHQKCGDLMSCFRPASSANRIFDVWPLNT